MLKLKLVDEESFEAVLSLQLAPQDAHFVAPNVRSLADAWLYRENNDVFPHAILWNGQVVGFLLLEIDREEKHYLIWRIMIDKAFQGRGYGRQAIEWVIEKARQDVACKIVKADYIKGNQRMCHLLESLGFEAYGQDNREIYMRLEVSNKEKK